MVIELVQHVLHHRIVNRDGDGGMGGREGS
jgi:hypothetical protein